MHRIWQPASTVFKSPPIACYATSRAGKSLLENEEDHKTQHDKLSPLQNKWIKMRHVKIDLPPDQRKDDRVTVEVVVELVSRADRSSSGFAAA